MPAAKPKVECYFTGAEFWTAFDSARVEYPGSDAKLKILKQGKKVFVQICAANGDGGDPINDSHPCPGSPGC